VFEVLQELEMIKILFDLEHWLVVNLSVNQIIGTLL
jgi:hypothetical protein